MAVVTIGVPGFRNARTIERTIASIRAQGFDDFRVLLSDDCSDDDTFQNATEAARGDRRFHVIRQEARRGFMHFGVLLRDAETPYFAWLAGDDWWAPDFLERTVAVLEAQPSAVSALPRCAFVGTGDGAASPLTGDIAGSWSERALAFLAQPSGTRIYGLFRTDVLKRAFPRRAMNAFDFCMMLGVLRQGAQIEVPGTLLFRERTDWRAYSRMVDDLYPPGLFRRYPILDMTLAAVRAGFVPPTPSALRALYRLNIDKRDEHAAVTTPEPFFRDLAERRGPPLPEERANLYALLAHEALKAPEADPDCRRTALAALERMRKDGNGRALMKLGDHWSTTGGDPVRAHAALAGAARLQAPGSELALATLRADQGWAPPEETTASLVSLALQGDPHAALRVARACCEGQVAGLSSATLAAIVGDAPDDEFGTAIRAKARLAAEGLGMLRDPDYALNLLGIISESNPWARRERGRILRSLGRDDEAMAEFSRATASGADWALVDLLALSQNHDLPEIRRLTLDTLRRTTDRDLVAAVERLLRPREDVGPEAPPAPATPPAPVQVPATATGEATVTALVMARNASGTLGRLFEHFAAERIPVLYVDHASTDDSWQIALAHRDAPVCGMVREPWLGHFDLTRQLQLKRDLVGLVETDWILHADADEFVETGTAEPLRKFLGRHAGTPVLAFDCDECAFLPCLEDERHAPASFPETMRRYVTLRERDRKQRVFRRDAPLDLWMRTGGHTVAGDAPAIGAERLRIRHYLGLSLDDLRAKYLTRVFSGQDRIKAWHGNRIGIFGDVVRSPNATLLHNLDLEGWRTDRPLTALPAFQARGECSEAAQPLPDETELVIATAGQLPAEWSGVLAAATAGIAAAHAGADTRLLMDAGTRPILHLIKLPNPDRDSEIRWLSGISAIRQAALIGPRRYAELRIEEWGEDLATLAERIAEIRAMPASIIRAFRRHRLLPGIHPGGSLRRLGGPLLIDLGYLDGILADDLG